MDRLCACTQKGRLQFYVIGPSCHHSEDADSLDLDVVSNKSHTSSRDDSVDNVDSAYHPGQSPVFSSLLVTRERCVS